MDNMRRNRLIEKVNPKISNEAKKLYDKLIRMEGVEDITHSSDISDGAYFRVEFKPSLGYSHNGDVYLTVFPAGNPNNFDVQVSGDNLKLTRNFADSTTESNILKFANLLQTKGIVTAADVFRLEGSLIFEDSNGRRQEYIIENIVKKSKLIEKESYGLNRKNNQLKEALDPRTYNKIQTLIKECLKEGMEVEITVPKKKIKR